MPSPTPAPVFRVALALVCGGAMLLYACYLGAFGVLLPALGETFHLGTGVQGRLFPANFAGFVVGVLLCGYLSDRFGRKAVLLGGTAGYAVGLAVFGTAPTFATALPAAALVGAGSGAMEVVASALAGDLYPERRAFLLNAIQVAFGVGAAAGPFVARAFLASGADWRALFLGLAAVNLLLIAVLAGLRVPPHAGREGIDRGALRATLADPAFGWLCLAQALYVGGEVSLFSWIPTYLRDAVPGGAAWASGTVTLFWTAMTVGRFATGGLIGRVPLARLTGVLAVGGALWAALAVLARGPVAIAVCVALAGLCFSGIFGLILAEAAERFPRVAGSALGGVVAAGGLGGAAVPWMVGALAEGTAGWRGALAVVPVTMAAVALLSFRLPPPRPVSPGTPR